MEQTYSVLDTHTGRELDLMLNGSKPLAMFYAEVAELPREELIPENAFEPYVNNGTFVRREADFESTFSEQLQRNPVFKYVFFAKTTESWRIDAMILLRTSFAKSNCSWNEALERIEGSLLGYTDEENNLHCERSALLKRLRERADGV